MRARLLEQTSDYGEPQIEIYFGDGHKNEIITLTEKGDFELSDRELSYRKITREQLEKDEDSWIYYQDRKYESQTMYERALKLVEKINN